MNKKGLTLLEVLLAIAILGIISAAFIPILAGSFTNLSNSKALTRDLFQAQQDLEQEMEIARNTETDASDYTLVVFGKTIVGHDLKKDILSEEGNASGEISVFVPKYKVVYDVPEIESVAIQAYRSGVLLTDPEFLFPLDSSITFTSSYTEGSQQEFLMNVYRWYMSPISIEEPKNYHDWIIIKEWNEARTPLSYADSEDFGFIPNIEADYDSLNFSRDFGMTADEIGIRFAGRYFVYSVTPYSLAGRVGEEVFSNAISTNRISSIDPVYISVEWSGATQYNVQTMHGTVSAKMQYGEPQEMAVTWIDPVIDIVSPTQDEEIRSGRVTGYPDPVEFHLTVNDAFVPTSLTLTGPDRLQVPFASQGTASYTYNYTVLDQNGNPMLGEAADWSLVGAPSGVTINQSTGVLMISNTTAGAFSFLVRATLVSNPAVVSDITVRTAKVDPTESTVEVTRSSDATNYTLLLRDDQGLPITIADEESILVNNRFSSSTLTYKTLEDTDGFVRGSGNNRVRFYVESYINYNNGTYSFRVRLQTNRSMTNVSTGGVQVSYFSGSVVVQSGLTIRTTTN